MTEKIEMKCVMKRKEAVIGSPRYLKRIKTVIE